MAVMDEFREERAAMKNGTPKEKLLYFWYYYKWYVIGGIIIIVILSSIIYEVATQKETGFYGVFLNSWETETSADYTQHFADAIGMDTQKYSVMLDTSLIITDSYDETSILSSQKLMAYIAGQTIDVIVSDADTIENLANNENFADLREILTPQQIETYKPYFYYVDKKVIEEKDKATQELNSTYTPNYPDPTKPEEMEEPIPVGLYVDTCQELTNAYIFSNHPVVLGVMVNSTQQETAIAFIDYIFQQN